METGVRRRAIFLTMVCVVAAGAAATGLIAARGDNADDVSRSPPVPIANREGKTDRQAVARLAAPGPVFPDSAAPTPTDLLRQAFANANAAANPSTTPSPDLGPPAPPIESPPLPSPRPKAADWQTSYTLLSEAQIAAIKDRINLTAVQAKYWPPVEAALKAIAARLHAARRANPHGQPALDPASSDVQQLKAAAAPLLAQLRDDQKREVRSLARIIGLDAIASRI
jgi:hypothetical protein